MPHEAVAHNPQVRPVSEHLSFGKSRLSRPARPSVPFPHLNFDAHYLLTPTIARATTPPWYKKYVHSYHYMCVVLSPYMVVVLMRPLIRSLITDYNPTSHVWFRVTHQLTNCLAKTRSMPYVRPYSHSSDLQVQQKWKSWSHICVLLSST
jgi:hypothetical protein